MKTTRTFKSGNSVAVRLPKSLGIKAGTEVVIREQRGKFVLEPLKSSDRIDLTGIAGSMPWLEPIRSKERIMAPRELDWEGKRLKRG